MRLDVSVSGQLELLVAMEGRARRVQDLRPAYLAVAEDFRAGEAALFAGAAGWAPVSAAYAARKASQGKGARPLVFTGELRASLTREGHRFSVLRLTAGSVVMGTKDPVANLLRRGARGAPARDPVRVTAAQGSRWVRIVGTFVIDGSLP